MRPLAMAGSVAGVLVALGGCFLFGLPSIQARHPGSYDDLVGLFPDCAKPTTVQYEPCNDAADILERVADPKKATEVFLHAWGRLIFDPVPDHRMQGNNRDPLGDSDFAKDAASERPALKAITLPALQEVYKRHPDNYTARMEASVEEIDLGSKDSFDVFRKAHEEAAKVPKRAKPSPSASPVGSASPAASPEPGATVIEL